MDGWGYRKSNILLIMKDGPLLNIPRVLNIENGQLKQRPYPALEKLRHNKETALGYANKFTRKLHPYEGKQYELIIDILDNDATEVYLNYVHLRLFQH